MLNLEALLRPAPGGTAADGLCSVVSGFSPGGLCPFFDIDGQRDNDSNDFEASVRP